MKYLYTNHNGIRVHLRAESLEVLMKKIGKKYRGDRAICEDTGEEIILPFKKYE